MRPNISMKVIGIDPGYDRIGIAILEGDRSRQSVIYSECFETGKNDTFDNRLVSVISHTREIIQRYTPEVCVLETLFFSNNQKTALNVAEVRGGLIYMVKESGCQIAQYTPIYVKQAVTGYGRSNKDNMIRMLEQLLTLPAKKRLDDEYDAIAIALTHLVSR